jgi:translation initiation factor IF-1
VRFGGPGGSSPLAQPIRRSRWRAAASIRSASRRVRLDRGHQRHSDRLLAIAKDTDKIELEGEVVEAFRSGMYKVLLDNGMETLGYTAGKMRRYRIRISPGDRVTIELSPYDPTRGRIVYRHR